jgi:hypothetical protein
MKIKVINKIIKKNKSKKKRQLNHSLRYILKIILIVLLFIPYIFISKFYEYMLSVKNREKYYYKRRTSKFKNYNESNLVTISDKINWLVIHDTNELKGKCADKILLHEYSKKKLGKDICNNILKVYNNTDEININELPNQFALKTNHGSGYNIIVHNKKNFNLKEAKKKLNHWLNIDYGELGTEFHYSFIKRKIFVEEYIGSMPINYKFLCYNGEPKYLYAAIKNEYRNANFFDMEFKPLDFNCLNPPLPANKFEKPKLFETMKNIARKLSSDFKFVRVDLYELNNEVKLGEMTFAPMNAYFYCKNKTHEIELGKGIITNSTIYDYFNLFLRYIGFCNF